MYICSQLYSWQNGRQCFSLEATANLEEYVGLWGRKGSKVCCLFHGAFWSLFSTLCSMCTLLLYAASIPPPCHLLQLKPSHSIPQEVSRSIFPCSSPVTNPFCWWYHQPQPSLPQSSFFLIFLWVCLFGFCPTLTCPYHASPLSVEMVLSFLWCKLFCGSCSTGTGVSTALWGGRWGRASLAVEG